jgi:hypothetical protein
MCKRRNWGRVVKTHTHQLKDPVRLLLFPCGIGKLQKMWEGALKGLIERIDMISSQHRRYALTMASHLWKNRHHSSMMPCLCCPGEALILLGNLLEFGLTRGADQHLPTRIPRLDVLPMLRTDRQQTIRAALVCLVVARMALHWFSCCALNGHGSTSWLPSLSLRSHLRFHRSVVHDSHDSITEGGFVDTKESQPMG